MRTAMQRCVSRKVCDARANGATTATAAQERAHARQTAAQRCSRPQSLPKHHTVAMQSHNEKTSPCKRVPASHLAVRRVVVRCVNLAASEHLFCSPQTAKEPGEHWLGAERAACSEYVGDPHKAKQFAVSGHQAHALLVAMHGYSGGGGAGLTRNGVTTDVPLRPTKPCTSQKAMFVTKEATVKRESLVHDSWDATHTVQQR